MSDSTREDTPGDNNEGKPFDVRDNMFAQVNFIFLYGMKDAFSNVVRRDANMSGDPDQDIYVLVTNYLDFMFQLGYGVDNIREVISEHLSTMEEMGLNEEDDDESVPVVPPSDNASLQEGEDEDPLAQDVIRIGDKAYEDVDDIVSDDESFENFVTQFSKEENLLFRKIVFRAFLRYVIHSGQDDEQ